MQHDHVLKKLNFDLLTPRVEEAGSDPGGLRSKKCYHVVVFVILFNLICSMIMF